MHIWNRRYPANELAHPAHPAHPGYPGNLGNRVHAALIKCLCFRITDPAILALSDFSEKQFVSIKCKGIKSRIVLCIARQDCILRHFLIWLATCASASYAST